MHSEERPTLGTRIGRRGTPSSTPPGTLPPSLRAYYAGRQNAQQTRKKVRKDRIDQRGQRCAPNEGRMGRRVPASVCCVHKPSPTPTAKSTQRGSDHQSPSKNRQHACSPVIFSGARSTSMTRRDRTSRLIFMGSARVKETGGRQRTKKKPPPVVRATEHDATETQAQLSFARDAVHHYFIVLRKARVTPSLCLLLHLSLLSQNINLSVASKKHQPLSG